MQHLLGTVGMRGQMSHRDIEEKFELLLEINDTFLDRAVSSHKDIVSMLFLCFLCLNTNLAYCRTL